MSETPTRQQTVEANIEAATDQYGVGNINAILLQILSDISVSLAMLVDSSSTTETTPSNDAEETN